MKIPIIIPGTVLLALLIMTGPALAEVSVVCDGQGNYVRSLLLFKENKGYPSYWEPVRGGVPSYLMLNIEGDYWDDGKPSLAEHPFNKLPWVAWSHFNGRDKDIFYARWNGVEWSRPLPVHASEGHDREPAIAFSASGIPFLTFTKTSEISQVYLSAFLNGQWLSPLLISDPAIPSSAPTLVFAGNTAVVTFLTPEGIIVIHLENIGDIGSYAGSGIEEGPNPFPENTSGTGPGNGGVNGGTGDRDR